MKNGVPIKYFWRSLGKVVGIFTLLFSVLLLPMLHHHPAYEHAHGETKGHEHQSFAHADFFPDAIHGHEHSGDPESDERHFDFSNHSSEHRFSQIDLFSHHIAQSFQFTSILKKQQIALAQGSPELSMFLNFQEDGLKHQNTLPLRTPQFSPPSLRGPPYFA